MKRLLWTMLVLLLFNVVGSFTLDYGYTHNYILLKIVGSCFYMFGGMWLEGRIRK